MHIINANIYNCSCTSGFLVSESASRNAASSRITRFSIIDVSGDTSVYQFSGKLQVCGESTMNSNLQNFSGCLGRFDHCCCVFECCGHWFLTKNVFSCFESCHGWVSVCLIICANAHSIDLVEFEHFFNTCKRMLLWYTPFLSSLDSLFLENIANCDQLKTTSFFVSATMCA